MISLPSNETVNEPADRADCDLPKSAGSDAELLKMVVAANTAHDPKERLGRNENAQAIAQDDKWRRNSQLPSQQ